MLSAPSPLPLRDVSLSDLAQRHGLELDGKDAPVSFLGLVRSSGGVAGVLTYVTSAGYMDEFAESSSDFAIVEARFARDIDKPILICPDERAEETFFKIHLDLVMNGQVTLLDAYRHPSAVVHRAAVVMDNVQLGEGAVVEPGAVVYPNTIVGSGSVIQANATVGGEGFEVKYIGGKRTMIPHTGGVFLGTEATIGSSTCVDRGLFGTFTIIGDRTSVDNLVHIAHNVVIGADCGVVAAAEISGSAHLGDGVWYGPNAACNHEIKFGDYSFVGTGSVVTRDVPAFTLVAGSPAKPLGTVCRCRTRVTIAEDPATCPVCGTRLARDERGSIRIVSEN